VKRIVWKAGEIMAIYQKLERIGDRLVIVIPEEEIVRLNLENGQLMKVDPASDDEIAGLPEDIREAFERSWKRSEKSYRYLSGR
jgi:hypothetical protein